MKRLTRIRCWSVAAAVAAVCGLGMTGAGGAAAQPSYSYLDGLAAQLTAPGPPPGANDWKCRPDAAHPNPVVLLHGLSNDTITWNTLSPALADAGYCVFTTTYGRDWLGPIGAVTSVQESARQIAAFIDRVRAATGVSKVDLVGHSMGGAIGFYYLNHLDGIPKVDDYIALASPLHGTDMSGVQTAFADILGIPAIERKCGGPCQVGVGSPFLRVINPDPAIAPAIKFTTIVTRYDQIATPYTTGMLRGPNVRNVVVQDRCATDYTEHAELTADPIAVREVLNALRPATAVRPRCTTVLPFIGPIR